MSYLLFSRKMRAALLAILLHKTAYASNEDVKKGSSSALGFQPETVKFKFYRYPSIETFRPEKIDYADGMGYCVEKAHGSNLCIATNGGSFQFFSRNLPLDENSRFVGGFKEFVPKLRKIASMALEDLKRIKKEASVMYLYGEVIGNIYPGYKSAYRHVQRKVYYSPNLEFYPFDIGYLRTESEEEMEERVKTNMKKLEELESKGVPDESYNEVKKNCERVPQTFLNLLEYSKTLDILTNLQIDVDDHYIRPVVKKRGKYNDMIEYLMALLLHKNEKDKEEKRTLIPEQVHLSKEQAEKYAQITGSEISYTPHRLGTIEKEEAEGVIIRHETEFSLARKRYWDPGHYKAEKYPKKGDETSSSKGRTKGALDLILQKSLISVTSHFGMENVYEKSMNVEIFASLLKDAWENMKKELDFEGEGESDVEDTKKVLLKKALLIRNRFYGSEAKSGDKNKKRNLSKEEYDSAVMQFDQFLKGEVADVCSRKEDGLEVSTKGRSTPFAAES